MTRADLIENINSLADDIENDVELDEVIEQLHRLADRIDSEGVDK